MKRTGFRRPTKAELRRTLRQRDQRQRATLAKRRRSKDGHRPGVWTPSGSRWRHLAAQVRARDQETCRWCGQPTTGERAAVDHIFPRRLLPPAEANTLSNLAWLHADCHARKLKAEGKLFRGNPGWFWRFVDSVTLTGPMPGPGFQARALVRLAELVYGT